MNKPAQICGFGGERLIDFGGSLAVFRSSSGFPFDIVQVQHPASTEDASSRTEPIYDQLFFAWTFLRTEVWSIDEGSEAGKSGPREMDVIMVRNRLKLNKNVTVLSPPDITSRTQPTECQDLPRETPACHFISPSGR